MKAKIIKDVSIEQLRKMLPPVFIQKINYVSNFKANCTCLLFGANSHNVIISSTINKTLKKVNSHGNLIACAYTFTQEAKEILTKNKVFIIEISDFYWTDESYENIKK